MRKLKIVIGGFIGIMPAGGITWDYVQYPLGLSLLGHDVYYIEDTRLFPIYQKAGSDWNDASSCVNHLRDVMTHFGFAGRWAYRDEASGKSFGLSEFEIKKICSTADIFINISCSTFLREEYLSIGTRILIDSDPMFTQIQYDSRQMFTPGNARMFELVTAHTHFFTFGENIGAPDCQIPLNGINWQPTRQPICLEHWKVVHRAANTSTNLTTVMNWSAGKILQYKDQSWGQKDEEFDKIMSLPLHFPSLELNVVMNQTGGAKSFPRHRLTQNRWKILEPNEVAGNWIRYSNFIENSYGEFSVAKSTYVKANTGWFSCRSACYLASGRPVVTQDTGWTKFISADKGLYAFTDLESAIHSVNKVVMDKTMQVSAARSIAVEFFDSSKVLTDMLNRI